MPCGINTCTNCHGQYEPTSLEDADDPRRLCPKCYKAIVLGKVDGYEPHPDEVPPDAPETRRIESFMMALALHSDVAWETPTGEYVLAQSWAKVYDFSHGILTESGRKYLKGLS